MDKLDRLVWADGISFNSYGVRIGIRVSTAGILKDLLGALPPAWKPSASRIVERMYSVIAGRESARRNLRLYNLVYANTKRIAREAEFDRMLDALESDIQLYVAENAPRRVFVHAGVVEWQGQAIIIPGQSFSGKTTLVAEMVKAGAVYYSDEYAVIDREGRVHPYRRPLAIRGDGDSAKAIKQEVKQLGGRTGTKPLPVAVVLICDYKPGARWRPRRLSKGEGAVAMLANTASARRQPESAIATINRVVSGAIVFKGKRGEASQVIDSVFDLLSRQSKSAR